MSERQWLPMVGRFSTPRGKLPFFDTGMMASPVEQAELLGLQVAIANAHSASQRQQAEDAVIAWALDSKARLGCNFLPGSMVAITNDGLIVTSSPWMERI